MSIDLPPDFQLEVILTNGQKIWRGDIRNLTNIIIQQAKGDIVRSFMAAFRKTTIKIMSVVTGRLVPSVAELTGLMSVAFFNAFEVNQNIGQSQDIQELEFSFNVDRFVDSVISPTGVSYGRKHLRQSSDFNPAFEGGYKDPTKKGTKPIDLLELEPLFDEFAVEIIRNMRIWGYDLE